MQHNHPLALNQEAKVPPQTKLRATKTKHLVIKIKHQETKIKHQVKTKLPIAPALQIILQTNIHPIIMAQV